MITTRCFRSRRFRGLAPQKPAQSPVHDWTIPQTRECSFRTAVHVQELIAYEHPPQVQEGDHLRLKCIGHMGEDLMLRFESRYERDEFSVHLQLIISGQIVCDIK